MVKKHCKKNSNLHWFEHTSYNLLTSLSCDNLVQVSEQTKIVYTMISRWCGTEGNWSNDQQKGMSKKCQVCLMSLLTLQIFSHKCPQETFQTPSPDTMTFIQQQILRVHYTIPEFYHANGRTFVIWQLHRNGLKTLTLFSSAFFV